MELQTDLYREVTGGRAWSNWQHWKFTGLNITDEESFKSPEHTEGQKKFIHYVVCLTTGPQPPYDMPKASLRQVQNLLTTGPKPPYNRSKASIRQVQSLLTTDLHRLRSKASHFNFQYPLVSFRVFSGCLRLLPHLPITFIFLLYFFLQ